MGEVFKIQISMTEPVMLLIYNKDKSIMKEYPACQEMIDFMDGDLKKYVKGSVNSLGFLGINKNDIVTGYDF